MSDTKDIPFSPPWQISDLGKPDQPKATELDARPAVARFAQIPIVVAEDDYLMKPFDKSELSARIQVGLRILELHAALAARVKELEKATGEIHDLKLRIPL